MKNLTIAHRILMMIGVSVLSLLLVGFVGLFVANKGTESIRQINEGAQPRIQALGEVRQIFMESRINIYALFLNTDQMEMDSLEQRLGGSIGEIDMKLKNYEKLIAGDEDKKLLDADIANVKAFMDYFSNEIMPLLRDGENEKARDLLMSKLAPLGYNTLKGFNTHMEHNTKLSAESTSQAVAAAVKGRIVSIGAMALGFVAVGALGFFLLTNIRASLRQIQSMVNRIETDLDFTVRVNVKKHDEIGQTTSALNRLLDKLQDNLNSIAAGAQSVAAAANEMSSTSTHVATASTQQSEAASDMAATVEEMTVSINHVADRSLEANRISSESGRLASSGEEVIGHTVEDMNEIASTVNEAAALIQQLEANSQQISNVVAVIRDVADQTNLLALNAAIEAARAGEQGRGFAVVADEVRKLAERTSTSTKEISSTIDTMRASASNAVDSMQGVVSRVALGVERAQEANTSIKQIGEGSRNAVHMVEEITEAIREQGTATNNIAMQVERIAQMSEESSAAAANSAQAAQDLDRLAGDMQRIVSAYRL
ncbi:MAG: methyl-accepting chemotaxis protein [Propionivibrio sp.]|nr:methyl-accepting chemotaxis protein [Propionivibrio sp.]MBP6709728.1 methyl-accepting chemotaxis protein [Propionivibrio sp.]